MAEEAVRNEVNSIKIVTFFAFLIAMSHTECSTDCGLTRAPPPEVRNMLEEGAGKMGRGWTAERRQRGPGLCLASNMTSLALSCKQSPGAGATGEQGRTGSVRIKFI